MYSRSQHSFCIINSDAIIPHNGFYDYSANCLPLNFLKIFSPLDEWSGGLIVYGLSLLYANMPLASEAVLELCEGSEKITIELIYGLDIYGF